MKFHDKYVCDPNYFSIEIKPHPFMGKSANICFIMNEEEALIIKKNFRDFNFTKEEREEALKSCCTVLINQHERTIFNRFQEEDQHMAALNIKRHLKAVRNKLGVIIWQR